MAAASRVIALLANLPDNPHKVDVLTDLKSSLSLCSRDEIASVAASSPLDAVFGCIKSSREETEIACSVLEDLLGSVAATTVFSRFEPEIEAGLLQDHASIKNLCLAQLERIAFSDAAILLTRPSILTELIDLIGADDGAQHKKARDILFAVATTNASCETIFKESSHVCQHFANALQQSDSVTWFRLMQVIVDASKASEATMIACAGCGLLGMLLNKMDECMRTDDLLSQLCLIDLFGELMVTRHGYGFLQQHGIISTFYGMFRRAEDDPVMALLQPGLMKLFAGLARLQPKVACSSYPDFYSSTCRGVLAADEQCRSLCIETLGFVAEPPECRPPMQQLLGQRLSETLNQLGQATYRGGPNEVKSKVLNTISKLIYLKVEDQTDELLQLTANWYQCISGQRPLLEHLLKLSRQPFADVRFACIRVYAALATCQWGQSIMHDTPLFCEYLLDRDTEQDKEGKELKFKVIQKLVASPTTCLVFDAAFVLRLRVYERQGPFFVYAQAEVATES